MPKYPAKTNRKRPSSAGPQLLRGHVKPRPIAANSPLEHEADNEAQELLRSGDASWSSVGDAFNDLKLAAQKRFGRDLNSITLSQSAPSQHLTESLGAQGVTLGSEIHLSPRSHTNTLAAAHTVAHEMVHAVQQTGGATGETAVSSAPAGLALRRNLALGEQWFAVKLNRLNHLLSYGFLDWAITDAEATEALQLLQGMTSTERATALGSIRVDRLQDNLPEQSQRDQLDIMLKQTEGLRTEVQDLNALLDTHVFDWAVTDAEAITVLRRLLALSAPERHYAVMGINQRVLLDNLEPDAQAAFNDLWNDAQAWWNRQRQQRDPLKPGDEVKVRVYNAVSGDFEDSMYPDLIHQITSDNTLRLPPLGNFSTVGQRPDDLAAIISDAFVTEQYLHKAVVSIEVVRRRGEAFNAQEFDFKQDQPTEVLIPGDTFTLMVVQSWGWEEQTDFSKSYHIAPGGSVELPHLGRIEAAGKTRAELIAEVQQRLSGWFKQPPIVWAWIRSHGRNVYRPPRDDEKPRVMSQHNIQKSLDEQNKLALPKRTPVDIYLDFYRQKSEELKSEKLNERDRRVGQQALFRFMEWVSDNHANESTLNNNNPYSIYGNIYTPMWIGEIKRESRKKVEEESRARESAEHSAMVNAKMDDYWRWARARWAAASVKFRSAGPAHLITEHPYREIGMDALTDAVLSWAHANQDHPDFKYLTPTQVADILINEDLALATVVELGKKALPRLEYFPELDRTRRTLGHTAFETLIGFLPIAGEAQDFNDLTTGVSITGEKLSGGERVIAGFALIIPFVPASALRGGDELADAVGDIAKATGRSIDEVDDVFRVAGNLTQSDARHIERIMDTVSQKKKLTNADLDILDDIALKLKGPLEELAEARKLGGKLPVKPLRFDPTTASRLVPGTSEHMAQRWIEHQVRNGAKYSKLSSRIDPKWEKLYNTILANKRAGGVFENSSINWLSGGFLPGIVKNNELMISTAKGAKGFIPDAVKGNPASLIWGNAYHFVEVKGWKNMSKTGNLKAMIEYVDQFGGHVEVVFRSAKHADGATTLTKPLQRALDDLVSQGKATIRQYPP